jgi:exodeoxyribonuclease VII large subunit
VNQDLVQKLKDWRAKKVKAEGVEPYLVLQNQTIDNIAESMPTNKDEFVAVKGLGDKKFEKYGQEILAIVNDQPSEETSSSEITDDNTVYSVSSFLNLINSKLCEIDAKVKGEISSVDIRERYLTFSIKDSDDDSLLGCFMWTHDYELSCIDLEIGMEVVVHGIPQIYKKGGRFSLQADAIELVGEGALKKAYDELKRKLTTEGVFDESKKRQIPTLPLKIGLITSKDGAVIHDFGNNLGKFGFITKFYDSRVEGVLAVRELVEAIRYFKNQDIDILVVIRGGGSLESLQAFNNEAVIREIVDYPIPVICGIGHDKDVPLFALATDRAYSTPTAVAKELNSSWEQAVSKLDNLTLVIINKFQPILSDSKNVIAKYFSDMDLFQQKLMQKIGRINQFAKDIVHNYSLQLSETRNSINQSQSTVERNFRQLAKLIDETKRLIGNVLVRFQFGLKGSSRKIDSFIEALVSRYNNQIESTSTTIRNYAVAINLNNPGRQLRLGYSIVLSDGKVVKSIHQISKGGIIINKVSDGDIKSSVEDIKSKE